MNISIFGMGYVGCILAVGHAHLGHTIIGVDVNTRKLELLKEGKSPVVEKDIEKYLKEALQKNLFETTIDVTHALLNSDISLVSVGTPSDSQGQIDLSYTLSVCEDIGKALKEKKEYHLIVFKSTLVPGTVEKTIIPLLEKKSGKKSGKDFGIVHNPEFLREGSGMEDFFSPPTIVFGQLDEQSGKLLEGIYNGIESPIVRTSIKIGEMIKYVNNTYHALKVSFANEIGKIATAMNIDSKELMDIFSMDTQLNISKAYLKPGAPYGGSCLTKDQEALKFESKKLGLTIPLIDSIKQSNDQHITYCTSVIENLGKKSVGFLGISFKEGTDDLRESPTLYIVENLVKNKFNIKIYDENVLHQEKFGANKDIFEKKYPFLKGLFVETLSELAKSDVIVVNNKNEQLLSILKDNHTLVDMNRSYDSSTLPSHYIHP